MPPAKLYNLTPSFNKLDQSHYEWDTLQQSQLPMQFRRLAKKNDQ